MKSRTFGGSARGQIFRSARCLVAISVLLIVGGRSSDAAPCEPAPAKKVVILIADLDGAAEMREKATGQLEARLREGTKAKKYDDIEVKRLGDVITAAQGADVALARGKEKNAALVLWGRFENGESEPSLVVRCQMVPSLVFEPEFKPEDVDDLEQPDERAYGFDGRMEPAIAELDNLTELVLGTARLALADYAGAVAHYSALLEALQPDQADQLGAIHLLRARTYCLKHDLERAMADLEQATSQLRDPTPAYADRAEIFDERGDIDRAIADWSEAIRRKPDAYWLFSVRGSAFQSKGDHDRAIADFTEVIRLRPDDSLNFQERARSYLANGEFDRALADYGRAISLSPKSPWAYYERGNVYLGKNDPERAITDLSDAIVRKPDFAVAYYSRGGAHLVKNEKDLAIADFKKARELTDEPALREAVDDVLEKLTSK